MVKEFRELGVVGQVVEPLLAAQHWNYRLARPDRFHQQAPMFPVLRRTDETRPPGHRYRSVGAQGIGKRGQAVAAIAVLAEYAATNQRPHQPLEGAGVRADTVRQLI